MEIKLDMMQTAAIAVVVYYFGAWVKSKVSILEKFCIPSPVVGGLIFAFLNLFLRLSGTLSLELDDTLQKPFMMVFFTTIGMGASIKLIKKGGIQVIIFWFVACLLCVLQNTIGIFLAKALGQSPFLGMLCGSVTMTGGHGTAGVFGPMFQTKYGVVGATATAMAAATFGLVMGSLIGGPIGKRLIESKNLKSNSVESEIVDAEVAAGVKNNDEPVNYDEMFRTLTIILISIGIGAVLEKFFVKVGITLPSYVNSMIIAAIILNFGESTGKWHINQKCTDILGNIGLNVFLSMALVGLKLWELAAVAGPMLIILVVQTVVMAIFAYFITFNLLGRDFDGAVLAAGHCGFGMGATANGIANMTAVVERFGPAPRAFFVLPIVGAFLIDFANSLIIMVFVNIFNK